MGYGSAGPSIFDPTARALIDAGATPEVTEATLTNLIGTLRSLDWDTAHESLAGFADNPAVVAAFAAHGITADTPDDEPEADGLTKWPRLLVVGQDVTPEQADDILIRTTSLYELYSNDEAWTHALHRVFDLTLSAHGSPTSESIKERYEELGILRLSSLHNYAITSPWIDGPHSWCSWGGRIGCTTYNVGEWPDRDNVTAEWELIAVSFPYLDLAAQFLGDDGDGPVLAQWRVTGGHVTEERPGPRIAEPTAVNLGAVYKRMFGADGQRGVSLGRLRSAIARVRATQAAANGGAR
ncbi:hypothetical protein [Embleya sp. NPDC001921]